MTEEHVSKPIPAEQIGVGQIRIWYHLPFAIYEGLPKDSAPEGWIEEKEKTTEDQSNYFHSYVSDALFGEGDSQNGASNTIKRFVRKDLEQVVFQAQKSVEDPESGIYHFPTFEGGVDEVALRVFRPEGNISRLNPALGILVVAIDIKRLSEQDKAATQERTLDNCRALTLADAQNALDWMRRSFARWPASDIRNGPNNTYAAGDMIERLRIIGDVAKPRWQTVTAPFEIAPWVKCLMRPWRVNSDDVEFFGDERAFMTSAILLGREAPPKDEKNSEAAYRALKAASERQVVNSVSDADMFRLAEADPAGAGYSYGKAFVEERLVEYQYLRHAPDSDNQSGNTTRILIAHHHLCLVGAGYFNEHHIIGIGRSEWDRLNNANKDGPEGDMPTRERNSSHVESYYRHMQFLCVYEYFRLILFSQRLTRIVKKRKADASFDFPRELQKLREDFLEFTHIHHFSNVSHQLQPREMFSQLYRAMELDGRFEEIEVELKSASEFVAGKQTQEVSERAERLNTLILNGVPLSLIAGAAGSNLFIGDAHPVDGVGSLDWTTQGDHLAWIVLVVSSVWAGLFIGAQVLQGVGIKATLRRTYIWIVVVSCSVLWLNFGTIFRILSWNN